MAFAAISLPFLNQRIPILFLMSQPLGPRMAGILTQKCQNGGQDFVS
jgi:hypothetical protein